jgi:hypothetical protein
MDRLRLVTERLVGRRRGMLRMQEGAAGQQGPVPVKQRMLMCLTMDRVQTRVGRFLVDAHRSSQYG